MDVWRLGCVWRGDDMTFGKYWLMLMCMKNFGGVRVGCCEIVFKDVVGVDLVIMTWDSYRLHKYTVQGDVNRR